MITSLNWHMMINKRDILWPIRVWMGIRFAVQHRVLRSSKWVCERWMDLENETNLEARYQFLMIL